MTSDERAAVCTRCNDTGYHGAWGDASSDDDSPRRCNHCDFHRGPERQRELERARALLAAQGLHVVTTAERDELTQLRERVAAAIRRFEIALEALRGQ